MTQGQDPTRAPSHPTAPVPVQPHPPHPTVPPPAGQVVPHQQPAGYQSPPVVAVVQAPGSKETVVAYLLWFFLGGVGADRFYLGRTAEGLIMLVLWLLGWATVWFLVGWLFLVPLYIWVLVNAFRIPGEVREANARAVCRLYGYR